MVEKEIAKLIIRLQGQTAELKQDFDKAQGHVSNFAGSIKKILAGIGVAVLARKLKNLVEEAINLQDQMAKTSQRVGVTTETLSGLKYAAEISGVSFGSLTSALRIFSKNMYDAASGTGEAKDAIADLGIIVTDQSGQLKDMETIIGEVAGKMSQMEDGTRKTAIAARIFGRSGAELIPLLNQGAEGIKKLTDEARKFGIVIDSEAAKRAEMFNDNLTRLRAMSKGLFIQIANEVLPTLINLTNAFIDGANRIDGYRSVITKLGDAFKSTVKIAIKLGAAIEIIATAIGGLKAIEFFTLSGDLKSAWFVAKELKNDIMAIYQGMKKTLEDLDKPIETVKTSLTQTTGEVKNLTKALVDMTKIRIEAALSHELKAIESTMQNIQQQYELGKITITEYYNRKRELAQQAAEAEIKALEALKAKAKDKAELEKIELSIFEKRADLARELSAISHEETMKIKEFSAKLKEMSQVQTAETDIGARYDQEIAILSEKYAEMINQVRAFNEEKFQLVNDGLTKEQAIKDLQAAYDVQRAQLTQQKELAIRKAYFDNLKRNYAEAADLMGDLYTISGGKVEEFFRLQKAFSAAQAIINAHEAASKAMAQGGIWGMVQAGIIFAKAMIHATAIASQQPPKFHKGGLITGDDEIDIRAKRNEYIMPDNAVRHYGIAAMDAIRNMILPKNFLTTLSSPQLAAAGNTYSVNVPVNIQDSKLANGLQRLIEKTVIKYLEEYT